MPAYTRTSDGGYKYTCICGTEIVYYHDTQEHPKRLVKCFECIKKENMNKEKKS